MFQAGIIVPCCVSAVEMGFNRILLSYKHTILVFFFCICYLLANLFGSLIYDWSTVYPNSVDWKNPANIWSDLLCFITIVVGGNCGVHAGFVYFH